MSQRNSGYAREPGDRYCKPEWVLHAGASHIPNIAARRCWDPAAASEQEIAPLRQHCPNVVGTDISTGINFLGQNNAIGADCIVCNPPFALAREFIEHALELVKPYAGVVAMLTRIDYDCAQTRRHLFAHPAFSKKLTLTRRIIWFARKGAAPSFNHCWLIWNWQHEGPPVLAYGPEE